MSKIYPVQSVIDGQPCFGCKLDEILATLKDGGAIQILTPIESITAQQRKWYKGVCLPHLVKHDENRESSAWWDREVKKECDGLNLLKPEYIILDDDSMVTRLTTKGVGKEKMKMFIDEILSKSIEKGWGIAAPSKELRSK